MKCEYPITLGGGKAFPCGQCLPCRFNRRRIWTHRILLEAAQYKDNCFVTLTYDDEHMPANGSLVPKDLQDFLKRFRSRIEPIKVRFYGVGEYGDQTQRPHYHLAIFGYPCCWYGNTRKSNTLSKSECCPVCASVRWSWSKGHIFVGSLEAHSAQYIAGYVTKKMTSKDDDRLGGRHPEFARMSNRPGIGLSAMHDVASVLMQFNLDKSQGDVPVALRHGSRQLPLGRYLRRKLRLMIGRDGNAPAEAIKKLDEELRPMFEAARDAAQSSSFVFPGRLDHFFKQEIHKANKGQIASSKARYHIFNRRKPL